MSAYTTQAAINGNIQMADLIALTDDVGTGQLNAGILNQVIANASGIVDWNCANIYGQQLPFNPVPLSVASMALTIACYMLYERRETPMEQNKFAPRYKDVMAFLSKVNTGEMHLDDVPTRDFPQGAISGRPTIYAGGIFGTGVVSTTM